MKRPNLFVLGAMKSGTTSLHEYLDRHPHVFMSPKKEPAYFVEEYGWSNGEKWYLNLFAAAREEQIIGESSTDYTKLPRFQGVPKRVEAFNPEARLIYIMRDPIERTISHYWWRVRFNGESRSMLEAIKEEPYYRAVSNYAMQLRPYIELFGLGNIKAITFEQMVEDPVATMRGVFDWLGLEPGLELTDGEIRKMTTPTQLDQVRGRGMLNSLRYSKFWNVTGPLVPARVRSVFKRAAVKTADTSEISTDAIERWLRPVQREQVRELSAMLGCEFPEWKTLRLNED
ncbi:MAG: sulfotransferase [Pseudomonadota bacterium]|nr:sulfotransferase [Pseudomonadota bacterium]